MFRIWSKILIDGKIQRQFVYENEGRYVHHEFFDYLSEICYELDVPTPVILKTHIVNFAKFNHVKFTPKDFVESIDFDALFLERIIV